MEGHDCSETSGSNTEKNKLDQAIIDDDDDDDELHIKQDSLEKMRFSDCC